MNTKNLTIMFVDLVGYTAKTSSSTRHEFMKSLETYKDTLHPIFSKFHGHIVKEIGDAYLAYFESPTNAVLCGVHLQNAINGKNKELPKQSRMQIKVAINTGEVHLTENDVYGNAVNLASRVEKITPAGRVYFTESVLLSMNKNEVSIGFVGKKMFKGIHHLVKVFTVLGKYEKIVMKVKKKKKDVESILIKIANMALLLIIILIAVCIIVFLLDPEIIDLLIGYLRNI